MYGTSVGGALCPRHPDQVARGTCTRCGTFMCDACSEGGTRTQCPDCREREGLGGFPLHRGTWNFSALWDVCWAAFQREWLMLSLGALITFGLSFVAQMLANLLPMVGGALNSGGLTVLLTAVGFVLQTTVSGVLALGLLRMVHEVLLGQRADLGRIFSQLHKTGTYLLALLFMMLMMLPAFAVVGGVMVGVLLMTGSGALNSRDFFSVMPVVLGVGVVALVPFLYLYLPLALVQPALAVDDDLSAVDALRRCYARVRGERLSVLGTVLVSMLVTFAGVIACCVGFFPATGLAYLLLVGLYLALRPEGGEAL